MKPEEAIQAVKEVTGMSLPWNDRHYEALQMALSALEKQIPKKPIELGPFSLFYKCPICKKSVNDDAGYCAVCGCKLNWSECES